MPDCMEKNPNHRSYFACRAWLPKDEWISILLKVTVYLLSIGVGYLLYSR